MFQALTFRSKNQNSTFLITLPVESGFSLHLQLFVCTNFLFVNILRTKFFSSFGIYPFANSSSKSVYYDARYSSFNSTQKCVCICICINIFIAVSTYYVYTHIYTFVRMIID